MTNKSKRSNVPRVSCPFAALLTAGINSQKYNQCSNEEYECEPEFHA